ncbi:MAG TPA: FkbM family methyltransferase [Tepidisphaeraceae bacterium]|nr:FkbM family methyltransferase [Tepidisphaeraceae bacterium]
MGLSESIRKKVEGTRLEPVVEGMRRARWPKLWRVGRKDHEALHIILPFLLRRSSNCVDVGANQGEMLEEFCRLAPHGTHVAFEPLPHQAKQLRERFPGVTINEAAVSDSAGETTFFHTLGDDAYSGLKRTDGAPRITGVQEIKVKLATLDDALPENYLVDMLKIDVEGAELAVLRGAKHTLARCRPVIIFEFQKERADSYGDSPRPYFDLLCTDLGYTLFRVDGKGPLTLETFQESFDAGDCFNFIAKQT